MQGPSGEQGRAVERIMARIRGHLQPDDSGSPVHYNRTFEAIADELAAFENRIQAGPTWPTRPSRTDR